MNAAARRASRIAQNVPKLSSCSAHRAARAHRCNVPSGSSGAARAHRCNVPTCAARAHRCPPNARIPQPGGAPWRSRTVPRDRTQFARGPYKHASRRMPRGTWILAQFPRSSSPSLTEANGKFLTNNDVKNDMGLTVIGFRLNG